MILTCPACGTQYVVKDGAIPPQGRQVRCAACRHSWTQEFMPPEAEPGQGSAVSGEAPGEAGEALPTQSGSSPTAAEVLEAAEEAPEPLIEGPDSEPAPEPSELARAIASTTDEPRPDDEPRTDSWEREPQAGRDWPDEPPVDAAGDDDFSPFAPRSEVEEPGRRSPFLVVLLLVLAIAAAAAAFWFLAPAEWKQRLGIAGVDETPLQLMVEGNDRQALASGNELLAVSGRVINPTNRVQRVPPIYAELKSSSGKVVYQWTIDPPTPRLAPGASARFNSAQVNVPAGGDDLTITLGAPRA